MVSCKRLSSSPPESPSAALQLQAAVHHSQTKLPQLTRVGLARLLHALLGLFQRFVALRLKLQGELHGIEGEAGGDNGTSV